MLVHGLQRFDGSRLVVPRSRSLQPDRQLLEERYQRFQQFGG